MYLEGACQGAHGLTTERAPAAAKVTPRRPGPLDAEHPLSPPGQATEGRPAGGSPVRLRPGRWAREGPLPPGRTAWPTAHAERILIIQQTGIVNARRDPCPKGNFYAIHGDAS